MGKHAQKRLVRRLDLEIFLSRIAPHPSPDVSLEQYTISETAAATILYLAAYSRCDIEGKSVLDLACGTGRLALGAAYLGAEEVVGADSDRVAIEAAHKNSRKAGLEGSVQWINCDLSAIVGRFDTVLQNPPFGVQTRNADRQFIEKALEVGSSIYSLHNHPVVDKKLISLLKRGGENLVQIPPSQFMQSFIERHGGEVKAVYALPMIIPKMFEFHTRSRREIVVDLYVLGKKT
jgi:putative methylase